MIAFIFHTSEDYLSFHQYKQIFFCIWFPVLKKKLNGKYNQKVFWIHCCIKSFINSSFRKIIKCYICSIHSKKNKVSTWFNLILKERNLKCIISASYSWVLFMEFKIYTARNNLFHISRLKHKSFIFFFYRIAFNQLKYFLFHYK